MSELVLAWFDNRDGAGWHEGQRRAMCGATPDYRIARTALSIRAAVSPRCRACVDTRVGCIEEQIKEVEEEAAAQIADLRLGIQELTP